MTLEEIWIKEPQCKLCTTPYLSNKIFKARIEKNEKLETIVRKFKDRYRKKTGNALTVEKLSYHFNHHFNKEKLNSYIDTLKDAQSTALQIIKTSGKNIEITEANKQSFSNMLDEALTFDDAYAIAFKKYMGIIDRIEEIQKRVDNEEIFKDEITKLSFYIKMEELLCKFKSNMIDEEIKKNHLKKLKEENKSVYIPVIINAILSCVKSSLKNLNFTDEKIHEFSFFLSKELNENWSDAIKNFSKMRDLNIIDIDAVNYKFK